MGAGASTTKLSGLLFAKKKVPKEEKNRTRVRELCDEASQWFISRNQQTLACALAFVPWITQQSFKEGTLDLDTVVVHRGSGAVVFSDASGFTALTERLASKPNGAELLSACLISFFTPLIDIITAYRGDVIKFSGDALTIYFPAVDDTQHPRMHPDVPPCGTYACQGHNPLELSVLRASACCVEIHKRLHMFDTGVDGVKLCLHIGVGCGDVTILQVGGVCPPETHVRRYEYVIAGPPLEQISIAEPLATNGETVLSPQAWEHVSHTVIEGKTVESRPEFHRLERMDETKHTFPTIKNSALEADNRIEYQFNLSELDVLRRYIPSAVFKQIEGGTLTYVNEMRNISVIFVQVCGVDVSTEEGSRISQLLMAGIQSACYAHEGTVNKFLVDDKGLMFLLCYGLPPLVHMDDPTRAVLFCFDAINVLKSLNLVGRFGITTGRNYCGVVGSNSRMEYTMLGDTVNLSARLMANAREMCILTDEATSMRAAPHVDFTAFPPIKVKGKTQMIPIFEPSLKRVPSLVGYEPSLPWKVCFPFPPQSVLLGGKCYLTDVTSWWELGFVKRLLKQESGPLCIKDVPRENAAQESVDEFGKSVTSTSNMRPKEMIVNDTLFRDGGVLVLSGPSGGGKAELCEYVTAHAVTGHNMIPLFGNMGDRPNEKLRPVSELLRSTLKVLRCEDPSLPEDDIQALLKILPTKFHDVVQWLGNGLGYEDMNQIRALQRDELSNPELYAQRRMEIRGAICHLVKDILTKKSIICVMQLIRGTNLFDMDTRAYWELAEDLGDIAHSSNKDSERCLVLALVVRNLDSENIPSMKLLEFAQQKGWHLETVPLEEECVREYCALHFKVDKREIPPPLLDFVTNLSNGNANFIRETLEQLVENGNVEVRRKGDSNEVIYTTDLAGLNIAKWHNTAMVGGAICLLESLDPLQAAVVKMATVFTGAFTINDLAASSCSRWAGATRFDTLRLFKSIATLVNRKIIDVDSRNQYDIEDSLELDRKGGANRPIASSDVTSISASANFAHMNSSTMREIGRGAHYFRLNNFLIRKVGASMILEQQKKAIKRQALIERVLQKDLPARMAELERKKAIPHIPWYYQIELPKRTARETRIIK